MVGNLYCKKHPKYKAIRKPKAECRVCGLLYAFLSSVNSWTLISMEDGGGVAFNRWDRSDFGR